MANKKNKNCNYGRIALILVIIIIGVWFFSHFRISIIPVNEIESIVNRTYYECPGVGLQEDIDRYLGCKYHHTEQIINSEILKRGITFWWK